MGDPEQVPGGLRPGGGATPPPRPAWVKALGIVLALLVVAVALVLVLADGEHGPGRHSPGRHTPPAEHSS